jgi:hypothetical protein
MAYTTAKLPMPASTAGCRLETGVPLDGPEELEPTAAGALVEADFLDESVLLLDELFASGAAILLTVLGVGTVVHCHSPSALTHE